MHVMGQPEACAPEVALHRAAAHCLGAAGIRVGTRVLPIVTWRRDDKRTVDGGPEGGDGVVIYHKGYLQGMEVDVRSIGRVHLTLSRMELLKG